MASTARRAWWTASALALGGTAWIALFDPYLPGRAIVDLLSGTYAAPPGPPPEITPFLTQRADGSPRALTLESVAAGFEQPTDLQFVPGSSRAAIVLQKTGRAQWLALPSGEHGRLFDVEVLTASEEGLLGLAFHPDFARNGKLYIDYVCKDGNHDVSRIAEWVVSSPADLPHASARQSKVLLQVEQPFPNHNAGQLAFGPDGMLYIGFGDGGAANDPFGNAQKPGTWLGKMLRIDVDHADAKQPYGVPKDNPFVADARYKPEIWALGLRNPWRYSFDPKGRLIVADVGQGAWEEVSIVQAGDNLGWDLKEGFVCASPGTACDAPGFVDPVHVYPRDRGKSITGGYVYLGKRVPWLRGKYLFGDFVSGRVFALDLPGDRKQRVEADEVGHWPILPSSFGRDADGELYVLDFARGTVYRLAPPPPSAAAKN